MENREAYLKAKKTVNARLALRLHLALFAIANLFMAIVNVVTSPQYLWFLWPLLGWGVGVCFHAMIVFAFYGKSSLRERMLKEEMEKELKKDIDTDGK